MSDNGILLIKLFIEAIALLLPGRPRLDPFKVFLLRRGLWRFTVGVFDVRGPLRAARLQGSFGGITGSPGASRGAAVGYIREPTLPILGWEASDQFVIMN